MDNHIDSVSIFTCKDSLQDLFKSFTQNKKKKGNEENTKAMYYKLFLNEQTILGNTAVP